MKGFIYYLNISNNYDKRHRHNKKNDTEKRNKQYKHCRGWEPLYPSNAGYKHCHNFRGYEKFVCQTEFDDE